MSPYNNRGGYNRGKYRGGYSKGSYSRGYRGHRHYSSKYHKNRKYGVVGVLVSAAAVLAWFGLTQNNDISTGTDAPTPTVTRNDALVKLQALPVKYQDPWDGFDRSQFGDPWSDDVDVQYGHNGCNTRDDILHRDMKNIVMRAGGCFVSSGTLFDEYTGNTLNFVRGPDTSDTVEVDHIVPLGDAWRKGAQELSVDERRNLANDPMNLQSVSRSVNQAKQAMDASQWLPPNADYHCTYVVRQIEVKSTYRMWVSQAEKDAMTQVLATC